MDQVIVNSRRDSRVRLRAFAIGFLLAAAAIVVMLYFLSEWIDYIDPDIVLLPPIVALLLFFAGAGVLGIWFRSRKCAMDVKSDGVWGTTILGRNVFLPINQITKVREKADVLCITAGKRKYRFAFLANAFQLREAIEETMQGSRPSRMQNSLAHPSDQNKKDGIAELSQKKNEAISKRKKGSAAIARDLKRYKKLCDQGIITREEFETKKRQLLEL